MGIIIDIVVLAILVLTIFLGYKRGLVKVVFKMFAFLVALIVTLVLYKPVTNLVINNTTLDETISNIIIENGTIEKTKDEKSNTVDKYIENAKNDIQNSVVTSVADTVAVNLVSIIVIIALFIVTRLLLILVSFFADSLAELPIIKQFNKAGGIIYGVLQGIVIILAILTIIYFISTTVKDFAVAKLINESIITKIVYYNNPILNIIF